MLTLVLVAVTGALAQAPPRTVHVEFYDLAFSHLVEAVQRAQPDSVFVMGPGVADRPVTLRVGPPLTVEEAVAAGSAAAGVEVAHVGRVYTFALRPGTPQPQRPAAPRDTTLPAPSPPPEFWTSHLLVNLDVKDAPLSEVMQKLSEVGRGDRQTGPVQISLEPDAKRLDVIHVTALIYQRPLGEVLDAICAQAGLTYAIRNTSEVGVILVVTPRPSLQVNVRYIVEKGKPAFRWLQEPPREEPEPVAAK